MVVHLWSQCSYKDRSSRKLTRQQPVNKRPCLKQDRKRSDTQDYAFTYIYKLWHIHTCNTHTHKSATKLPNQTVHLKYALIQLYKNPAVRQKNKDLLLHPLPYFNHSLQTGNKLRKVFTKKKRKVFTKKCFYKCLLISNWKHEAWQTTLCKQQN